MRIPSDFFSVGHVVLLSTVALAGFGIGVHQTQDRQQYDELTETRKALTEARKAIPKGPVTQITVDDHQLFLDPSNSTGCASDLNDCASRTCGTNGVGPCLTAHEIVEHHILMNGWAPK
jgi:hypothetical protein